MTNRVVVDPEDREQAARFLMIGWTVAPHKLNLRPGYEPDEETIDRWQAMFRAIAATQESGKP